MLQEHGHERFGEFRSTLLGLFGATAYEAAILGAANRLITGDAYAALAAAYRLRRVARAAGAATAGDRCARGGLVMAGCMLGLLVPLTRLLCCLRVAGFCSDADSVAGSSSAVHHSAPATASSSSSAVGASPVHTAHALGVLGRSSAKADSSSSSGASGALAAATRGGGTGNGSDPVTALLGPGALRLQLQPAGTASGLLPLFSSLAAGEYSAAAAVAKSSGRVFRGEADLAHEIAALHNQVHMAAEEQPRHGLAAHGGGGGGAKQQRHGDDDGLFDVDELLLWSQSNLEQQQ